MRRGEIVDFDLENTPLEIKTEGENSNNRYLYIFFYTAAGYAGGLQLEFEYTRVMYAFNGCSGKLHNFPTPPSASMVKDWRLTLQRKSGSVQFTIHCNGKQVLDVPISESTCAKKKDYKKNWTKKPVKKIEIYSSGFDADYYRPYVYEGKK